MKKRLILVSLGAMAVLVGVATFAANTAQWVNVTARVEKEIEVACVVRDPDTGRFTRDPDGCDFGIVLPQNGHEQFVEVTASKSFMKQGEKSSIDYWVLWECKQDETDWDNDDDVFECRYDLEETFVKDAQDNWTHDGYPEEGSLDGNLRDYIDIDAEATCFKAYTGPTSFPLDKDIEGIADGTVSQAKQKCIYDLKLLPPVCDGHFNPFTDPARGVDPEDPDTWPKSIECNEFLDSDDPQDWERFVELGDNFKIQVNELYKD